MIDHAATKQIPGGREWKASRLILGAWDSPCGKFRIIPQGKAFLLIAFVHEAEDDGVWTKRFTDVEAAMAQAEKM